MSVFKNKADADADGPVLWNFTEPAAQLASGTSDDTSVTANWELNPEPDTERTTYFVRVRRDDTSRPQASFLPWDTNLKSVLFQAISTTNIEDDYLFTIPNPFGDDWQISDPLNNTDELRIRQFVNSAQISFADYDLNVDNAGNDTYRFPDMWSDFPKFGIDGKPRVYGGRWPSDSNRGTWLNYTGSARVEATEMNDFSAFDWVVADNVMCGRPGNAPADGWQADWFLQQWKTLPGQAIRSASKVWTFDDECAGDPGDPTWHYEFKAGVDRSQ